MEKKIRNILKTKIIGKNVIFFDEINSTQIEAKKLAEEKNGYYQGHTCITLDMAYNNARIIAKPESNWLTI